MKCSKIPICSANIIIFGIKYLKRSPKAIIQLQSALLFLQYCNCTSALKSFLTNMHLKILYNIDRKQRESDRKQRESKSFNGFKIVFIYLSFSLYNMLLLNYVDFLYEHVKSFQYLLYSSIISLYSQWVWHPGILKKVVQEDTISRRYFLFKKILFVWDCFMCFRMFNISGH